ncbi:MAG: hypothetical protein IPK26_17865 [Planctomycetes bacterium]|nr:hypothetical protein [Planctomycetota bacterium]
MNSSGTVAALLEERLLRASPDTQGNLPPLDERSLTGRLGEIAKNSRIRVAATGLVAAGSDRFGAFGEDDGGCYLVLPEGTAVPEAGADAEISGSGDTAGCVGSTVCPIGDGRVAVLATWSVPGPMPGKGGIWVAARAARTLIALEGQPAPGTSHVFGALGTESDDVDPGARAVFANGQGDVVFSARLSSTSVNDPVHAFLNRLGVWLWRNGHLVLLAREGVPFEIEPGATRVLTAARPVRPSPWTDDGAVMLQVEWLPTDKDALAARSHLGKGPCRAVVALTVTGLPAGRAAPAPVDKPKPVADATAGKPSGPDSAPASADLSDWFGSRRSEDGLWSPPATAPDVDAVAVVMRRLEAAQRTKWSASRITRERDTLLFSVLQYWNELFSSGKRIEAKIAKLRQQWERAKKADDEPMSAALQAEIVKAEADQRRLIPTSSRRFPTLRGERERQDWLNHAAVLPLLFSSGDSNEPGGSARLFSGNGAAYLFAADLRNLHRMDVACSLRLGETRELAAQTLQQLATELVDNKEATTELQQQSDWLLAKVNDLKRLLRAPGELDVAKAQVIADEVLRWYLAADPAPELRDGR